MKRRLTRDISVRPNVPVELKHESLAEPPDLAVGLALGVKVRSTLSTTHAQTSERVLEGLLETQELEDGEVDRGVQAETALERSQRRVVLWTRKKEGEGETRRQDDGGASVPGHGNHG